MGIFYKAGLHDGKLIGKFKQGIFTYPLNLEPGEIKHVRPQNPKGPYPYITEELTFESLVDSAQLCGTLSLADNHKNGPLVVIVSGSGQQNRDGEVFGHKPYAVIADYLARNGISSFRYDDRGIGCSSGLRKDITTETNMIDAISAIKMLKERGAAKKYGIIGHSEGGEIAFMIAGEHPEYTDFIISLAGPSVRGDSIHYKQIIKLQPSVTKEEWEKSTAKLRETYPWFEFFLDYDPTDAIRKIKCPVMALFGSNDVQVDAAICTKALTENLKGNKKNVIKTYDGLNHLFQHSNTGMPNEYVNIEETISPEVLSEIAGWISDICF